eukprot:10838201-Prorocentrum_lima.AAC.1
MTTPLGRYLFAKRASLNCLRLLLASILTPLSLTGGRRRGGSQRAFPRLRSRSGMKDIAGSSKPTPCSAKPSETALSAGTATST